MKTETKKVIEKVCKFAVKNGYSWRWIQSVVFDDIYSDTDELITNDDVMALYEKVCVKKLYIPNVNFTGNDKPLTDSQRKKLVA